MSTQAASPLAAVYTCNLCRRTLTLKDPILIGEKPVQRMGRVAQMMAQHFDESHREEAMKLGLAGQQWGGWRLAEQFRHNDSDLAKYSNDARLQFRQTTKRVEITDEIIHAQVKAHLTPLLPEGADPTILITATKMLKTLRDKLEEKS